MIPVTLVSRNEVTLTTVSASTATRSPPVPDERRVPVSVKVSIQPLGSGSLLCQTLAKSVAPIARKRNVYDPPLWELKGIAASRVVEPSKRLRITSCVPLINVLYQ